MNPLELFKIYSENNAKNQHYVRVIIFILLDMDIRVYYKKYDGGYHMCLYNPFIYSLQIACEDAREDYIKIKDYYSV